MWGAKRGLLGAVLLAVSATGSARLVPNALSNPTATAPAVVHNVPAPAGTPGGRIPRALRRIENEQGVVSVSLGTRGVKHMRARIMRRTAYTLGVQAGAHWREKEVDALMQQQAPLLTQIFAFRPLLLDHGQVLPPVIDVVHGATRLNSPTSGSSVITTYRIEAPARLVSTAPNWRSWLWLQFPRLTRVSRLLLPKNDSEQAIWKREAAKGWAVGIATYNAAFDARLHTLQRDYLGMVRFAILARQRVVSVPRFATGSLGIQVNGQRLNIGQRLFRITWPAGFTPSRSWNPVAVSRGDLHGHRPS